jgi:hypothetical protein
MTARTAGEPISSVTPRPAATPRLVVRDLKAQADEALGRLAELARTDRLAHLGFCGVTAWNQLTEQLAGEPQLVEHAPREASAVCSTATLDRAAERRFVAHDTAGIERDRDRSASKRQQEQRARGR